MKDKKWTIDDILNSEEFKIFDIKAKKSIEKTEDDRLIEAFNKINAFIDLNKREPSNTNMSEYQMYAELKGIRDNEEKKIILKPHDKHNLFGEVEKSLPTIDDILSASNDLLNIDEDLEIFNFKHVPKEIERAESDFVAQRKAMKEKDFKKYEVMFHKVHQEIKDGKRKVLPFNKAEDNLTVGNFYFMDGIMLFLEEAGLKREEWVQRSGNRVRVDGRTRTIFENGTYSNMLFRSLGKQILKNGKMITNTEESTNQLILNNALSVNEDDNFSGNIYILKSLSNHENISSIQDLYKIGFTSDSVANRIKNAKNDPTFLYADVQKVRSYTCFNINANILEHLLHRFFAEACLDIEIIKGKRIEPREWFVVPYDVIERAIDLLLLGEIIYYKYDTQLKKIVPKID